MFMTILMITSVFSTVLMVTLMSESVQMITWVFVTVSKVRNPRVMTVPMITLLT